MRDFFGSNPELRFAGNDRLPSPRVAHCQRYEEMVRLRFGAARVSRERGVIR
jgi:hypothetical protein